MAEHMTFNHGVRSSTLRWVTSRQVLYPIIASRREAAGVNARGWWSGFLPDASPTNPDRFATRDRFGFIVYRKPRGRAFADRK